MSLLQKATLITTPTAHSNGTLHSIKGGAVADFDVVRGSAATRVNAEGLIEDISVLSGELVTNGDFSSGSTGWTLGTGWSISAGKALCDGTNLAYLTQASIIATGVSYKVQFDIVDYTSGSVKYRDNGLVSGQSFSGVGSYTDYVVAGGGQFRLMSENFIGSIDNISVVEIIDATNIPRIDYTTGEGVVLLEPQSTNLVTYSEDFTSLDARDNAVAISNQVVSPSGLLDADEITFDGTLYGRIETPFSATNGATYTISVYLKNKDLSDVTQVWLGFANVGQGQFITITNEWQRYDITLAANGTTEYPRIQFSGTGSLYAWGFQTEALSYATSYIPTSGAIATRLGDSVTGAGDATTFNSTEGVLYAEIAAIGDTGVFEVISLSDGSASNIVAILYRNTTNDFTAVVNSGGTTSLSKTIALADATDFIKVAVSYKLNEFKLYVNGVLEFTDTSGNAPIGLNTLQMTDSNGTSNKFKGKVKALAVFNEALTDSELLCLTKI